MDQKSVETLSRLKSDMRKKKKLRGRMSVDDFKMLADTFNAKVHDTPKPTPKPRQWIKRLCCTCGSEFFNHVDWDRPSKFCKSCREMRRQAFARQKGKKKTKSRTQYSHYTIYQGGSPGGGKRR